MATKKPRVDPLPAIIELIDQFCREHLNEEYAAMCGQLAEKLARKRPSPLASGKPNAWASGIIRTIGMVNFLGDPSQTPHMKMSEIDAALGVSESTGSAKSMLIRKTLKMHQLDPQWTLPSRLDDNPLVWMLSINGFPMDIRHAPREAQEIAFERGLIPYIPESNTKFSGDRETKRPCIYQLKIRLIDSQPEIWRRIQVEDCTLDKLHEHIQTAMGWTNSHLHHFHVGKQPFGNPDLMQENFEEFDYQDSTVTRLSEIVPKAKKRFSFRYEYDFGDGWDHEIVVEKRVDPAPGQEYPVCLAGERACPPEDCGGIWGYADLVEAIKDKNHERHEELLEWLGESFDPDAFDPLETTKSIKTGMPYLF